MPILELECTKCGTKSEFLKLRSDEEPPKECEKCRGELQICFPSSGSFQLKGSGWAKDRYGK